ncbi:hypothetical protein CYY_003080 [Polysphondylium violaceum]|uniref:Carbohydrate binding domain-containing protein n=1 Tax=Polysphondylium violaceum TaxID=133409 RepID=A0A8J4Q097_9MYCE|nr:hypothetical protein CYY_003080 [Polysphondylium violaceum]
MKINSILLIAVVILSTAALTVFADTCYNSNSLEWRSGLTSRQLTLNGKKIAIQGIAWFGPETDTYAPGGLEFNSVENLLDILVAQKFNALRLPFSVDMVIRTRMPSKINYSLNPNLSGKNAMEVLEYVIQKCADRGILIVLELHRFDPREYISPLWYSQSCITNRDGQCINYTTQVVTDAWITITNRFKKYWNLWGLDIKNEPHDPATWGTGNAATDWDTAFKQISNAVQDATGFNGVYFLEGIQTSDSCGNGLNNWWGGNMHPWKCSTVHLNQANRVVYAPHMYCSSVFDQAYFNVPNYPNNLPDIWDSQFGFLTTWDTAFYSLVLGEWGCKVNSSKNEIWVQKFVQYLNQKGIENHLFFSLNPDSADTDSPINADWKTVRQDTMNYINKISPNPTKFKVSGSQICIIDGISTTSTPSTTGSTIGTSTTGTPSTTGAASSTTGGSGSTTGSTTSSTSTTGTSTTGSATSSTTGPSTTGSSTTTGGNTGSKLIITQNIGSQWNDGVNNYYLFNCEIKVNPSYNQIVSFPTFKTTPDQLPSQIWGLDLKSSSPNVWSPSWTFTISPSSPITFGYIHTQQLNFNLA